MKLSYALLGLAVASVTPTAAAFENEVAAFTGKGAPFAIEIDASHQPAEIKDAAYPQAAGMRNINGDCDVSFGVSASGVPHTIQVTQCSSDLFRAEATRITQGMRYTSAPGIVSANIRWTISPSEAVVNTASLR